MKIEEVLEKLKKDFDNELNRNFAHSDEYAEFNEGLLRGINLAIDVVNKKLKDISAEKLIMARAISGAVYEEYKELDYEHLKNHCENMGLLQFKEGEESDSENLSIPNKGK